MNIVKQKVQDRKSEYKPLIIFGPLASGKTTLIDHLGYNAPKFEFVLPRTSQTIFHNGAVSGRDYHPCDIQTLDNPDIEWLLVERMEANANAPFEKLVSGILAKDLLNVDDNDIPIIEMQTFKNVEKFMNQKILDCHYAYIAPPSI